MSGQKGNTYIFICKGHDDHDLNARSEGIHFEFI